MYNVVYQLIIKIATPPRVPNASNAFGIVCCHLSLPPTIKMTVEIRQKDYVDRATQTELPPLPSLNDDDHDAESPFNDELLSDDPLPVRQLHQKPHLGFNAPSSIARMMTSRVVSLPETSPPTRLKPSARVVSLTETTLNFMDDSLSSQENSISTIVSQISSDNSVHHLRRSTMPHTPSPPSSPESVMIIGNDVQVPISFSRHDHKMNKPSLVEDGDGELQILNRYA